MFLPAPGAYGFEILIDHVHQQSVPFVAEEAVDPLCVAQLVAWSRGITVALDHEAVQLASPWRTSQDAEAARGLESNKQREVQRAVRIRWPPPRLLRSTTSVRGRMGRTAATSTATFLFVDLVEVNGAAPPPR